MRAFGVNAYTAATAGDQVIEHHNESGAGAGHHEELYLVLAGHAEFTVAGETIDAPTGTLVFVPDVAAERGAVARADETTVLVIGGPADAPIPTSPFEYWFAAEPAYERRRLRPGGRDRFGRPRRVAAAGPAALPARLLPRPRRTA